MADRNERAVPDFGRVAASYKTYRPTYPTDLFEYLASAAPGHDRAWDCATGSGQAALGLKPYFRQVIATDASEKQIMQAVRMDGVEYFVAPAESSTIDPATVDLVVVAQALHWFDLTRFYAEVQRVAKPHGVLACLCYSLLKIDPAIDQLVSTLYGEILNDYWPAQRRLVDEQYATIEFSFDELSPPRFQMTQDWSLDQLAGYLGTWSAVAEFEKQQRTNPIELIWNELGRQWGDPQVAKTVNWPLHLRIGKTAKRK